MGETQLGRMQFRIMQVLWDRGRANAREITEALNATEPVAHSTVQTLLRQLEAKGAVSHEAEDRTFVFLPLLEGGQGQADRHARAAGSGLRRQRGEPGRPPAQAGAADAGRAGRAPSVDRSTAERLREARR